MVNEVVSNPILQPVPLAPRVKESTPTVGGGVEPQPKDDANAQGSEVAQVSGTQAAQGELDVEDAVQRVQDYVQTIDRDLQFSIDEDSGRTIIKVIDPETDEVVRQIPPEELLDILHSLESGSGGLVEAKA